MTSKYDRNIEDIERARMEESRIWSQRNQETGTSPFGTGAIVGSYGYGEPVWGAQSRTFTPTVPVPVYGPQIPVQQGQPYLPGVFSGFVPAQPIGMMQGLSGPQGIPVQSPAQQGYAPSSQMQINPHFVPAVQTPYLLFNPQPGTAPVQNLYAQPFPQPYFMYPAFNPQSQNIGQFETQWAGQSAGWEGPLQRGPFTRHGSRSLGRPPRGYKRSDELIRDEICKRLALTPDIDAIDVEVIVKDGDVVLKGTVDDRFAKRFVEEIAENTFGVRDISNEVRVGSRFPEHELSSVTKGREK